MKDSSFKVDNSFMAIPSDSYSMFKFVELYYCMYVRLSFPCLRTSV